MTALGSRAAEVMAWTIFLFLFGGCVAFMIIVGDTFGSVLRQYVINPLKLPPILAARQVMILIPAFAIMLPLSLQRSLGSLATASTVAVGVMMFTTVVIIGKCVYSMYTGIDGDGRPFLAGVSMFKFDIATFAAMPVMIFAYHCHVQAVPIYFELVDNPKLFERSQRCPAPGTMGQSGENANSIASTSSAVVATELPDSIVNVIARKLHGMYAVLAAAYAECTVMYLATGVAGYLLFPHTADSNILNNFSPEDTLMQIMRFLVGCAVVLHYPINQHIARSALYDLICRCGNSCLWSASSFSDFQLHVMLILGAVW
jgi:solute carrier family 38 (sodium-coupled neutral amino acid transporter), member 7/8